MSRMRPLLAAALLLLLVAPAGAGESAADSAYREYRIPEHSWWQWVARVSGSADHSDQSAFPGQSYRSGSFRGQLSTSATGGRETDPLVQSWSADVRFNGARRHSEQLRVDPGGEVTGEFTDGDLSEGLGAAYSLRAYPWSFPLALAAGTSQRFDFQQGSASTDFTWRDPVSVAHNLNSVSTGAWNYRAQLNLGLGVGRVRDATPVYEAQVLEDRLLETGALSRPLSRPARERLAALFATEGRFVFAHGRPDKYFWGEIGRVLAEDSALASGSVDLYDAHRILEPVTMRGSVLRPAGWFVGPAVYLESSQFHRVSEFAQSQSVYVADTLLFSSGSGYTTTDYSRQDVIQTALVAEYHHPAGHRWQYDASHTTWIGESGVPMFANTNASVLWIVSDRWFVDGFLGHALEWTGHGTDRAVERWDVIAGVDLSYFVEDSWAFTVTARELQSHNPDSFQRRGTFAFSITRVISGLFDAPGLVSTMRPTPGGR